MSLYFCPILLPVPRPGPGCHVEKWWQEGEEEPFPPIKFWHFEVKAPDGDRAYVAYACNWLRLSADIDCFASSEEACLSGAEAVLCC